MALGAHLTQITNVKYTPVKSKRISKLSSVIPDLNKFMSSQNIVTSVDTKLADLDRKKILAKLLKRI